MGLRGRRRASLILAGICLISLLGSVSFAALVIVTESGGRCPYDLCRSELVIEKDGRYAWSEGSPAAATVKRKGRLSARDVSKLAGHIKTASFEKIKAKRFSGTCPSAYDGRERTYIFSTAKGLETIPACTFAVDRALPLFKTTDELADRIYSERK